VGWALVVFLFVGMLLEIELMRIRKDIKGPEELSNFYNMFNEEVCRNEIVI
jgi:hypothetical protein